MPTHQAANKQNAILNYIKSTIASTGYSPTIEEIRAALQLSTKSLVAYHLNALRLQGKIEIVEFLPRGIRLPAG